MPQREVEIVARIGEVVRVAPEEAEVQLGGHHQNLVGGKPRDGEGVTTVRTPIDTEIVVGTFAKGTRRDVVDAIVRCYVRANAKKLSPLSVREALKNTGFDQGYRQIRRTGRIHHGCLVVRSDCRSTGCFLEGFQDGVYFGLISCAL